uniref:Rhodopsin domain-containing protein n=1 Tax=Fusarium oxysporum (strain Fo5176) TaxID=660025 RepID=A0A0D2XN56_FUSOF
MSCSFARISDIINRKLGRGRPSEMVVLERAEFDPRHGNGQSVFDLNVALMVITNILMILRLYVRGIMVKNLGWDDLLAVVAWGLVMTFSCIEFVLLTKGVGYHIQDVPKETLLQFLSLSPVDKLVFILAGGFVRLSILACLPRINRDTSTNKTRAQVIKMTLMLLLGLFAVVSTITRLILLLTTNMNVDILRVAPFFSLEINSGLWCGCLPAFQTLFEWTNNHYYNHYNMRKLSRSSAQEPLNDSWNRDYMTANPHVSIHGQPRDLKGNKTASDAESATGFAMLENERGIKLTTEFSVHVEDRVYTGEGSEDIVSRTPAWNAF